MKRKLLLKWTGENGIKLQYPLGQSDPDPDMYDITASLCKGITCEIGCGIGRMSKAFKSFNYIGVDINKLAIELAKIHYPEYAFETMHWDDNYPTADTYLFYTVLLHVPDYMLDHMIERCNHKRVVVFESMLSTLRINGTEYQRNAKTYIKLFKRHGYKKIEHLHLNSNTKPFFRDYLSFEVEK